MDVKLMTFLGKSKLQLTIGGIILVTILVLMFPPHLLTQKTPEQILVV